MGQSFVAQLVERSIPKPEDPGLNPVISNFLKNISLFITVEKTKIKK